MFGADLDADSWSANLDFDISILDWQRIKSEIFTGENLDVYLGGIGQGVAVTADPPVRDPGHGFCRHVGLSDRNAVGPPFTDAPPHVTRRSSMALAQPARRDSEISPPWAGRALVLARRCFCLARRGLRS